MIAGVPKVSDYLCDDCKAHMTALRGHLDDLGIAYEMDDQLVRGLDYYTKTVFEIVSNDIGAQGTCWCWGIPRSKKAPRCSSAWRTERRWRFR